MTPEQIAIDAIAKLLAILTPEVVKAFTGGQTAEEATKAAREMAAKIPNREDHGAWDADLERRKREP